MEDEEHKRGPIVLTETIKGRTVVYWTYATSTDTAYIYEIDGKGCFIPLNTLAEAQADARGEIDGTNKVTEEEIKAAMNPPTLH